MTSNFYGGLNVVNVSRRHLIDMANNMGRALDRMTINGHKTLLAYVLVVGRTVFFTPVPISKKERQYAINCVLSYAQHISSIESAKCSCASYPVQEVG